MTARRLPITVTALEADALLQHELQRFARSEPDALDAAGLGQLASFVAELRADELRMIRAGFTLAEVDAMLKARRAVAFGRYSEWEGVY